MRFVLDNSVTMRWLFNDGSPSDQKYAKQVLSLIGQAEVIVPTVWHLEVANVIARAERSYGLTEARSSEFIHALDRMNFAVDHATSLHALGDTLQISRRYNLSTYDSAYLELALREGLPMATLDKELIKALKRTGASRVEF